ncbi:MAG: IS66 family transposase [Bacteroidales bacterium]|jgi:transposase
MESTETIIITKAEYLEFLDFKAQVSVLKYELAELRRMIFGVKSERFIAPVPNQPTLFELPEAEVIEKPKEEITYTRNKSKVKNHPLRLELPAHLPRKREVIEPEELPEGAKKIGETITEVLDYTPSNIFVRQIIRPKYVVSQDDEKTQIVTAALPSLPIPKGNAGAGLLAHILISKFVDHLPFYRQAQIFKRQQLTISESTIGGWFNASCRLLEPLYETLKNKMLSTDYLMADETPIPVQTRDKPGATHKGYHWVYYDPGNKLVLFDYQKTRGREGPDELLKNFVGFLQTDAYTAYNNLRNRANIIQMACMAHARRKFEHALNNDPALATEALVMFGKLYEIERDAREQNLSHDDIKALRQEKSLPVLQQMEAWLKEKLNLVLPKSAIGQAIAYTLTLWPRLTRYIEQGRFNIDNNLTENSIRPVALGRKNYMFAGSHDAAQHAAIVYSLLATCKINNVEPFEWLSKTLSQISDHPANQLHKLLPGQK